MGISEKLQVEGGLESEAKKWVIAGIPTRAPLKQIRTKKISKDVESEEEEQQQRPTTPTAEEAKIPERLSCPPAPRKRRPSSKCNFTGGVREFFNPPDLESVFIRHVERAS